MDATWQPYCWAGAAGLRVGLRELKSLAPPSAGRLPNRLRGLVGESKMADLRSVAEAASNAHDADIYFYSGPIEDAGFGELAGAVTSGAKSGRDRAILILVTSGGSANAGYQIARLMQKMYAEFWLYCPSRCKSSGTLVAIGAHRLIMDSFSELGPLDVQLLKEDEIGARKSGLLARSTFDALADEAFRLYERLMINIKVKSQSLVSFKLASQLAAEMSSKLLSQVYAQISPDIVGNEKRDLDIAIQYGLRLGIISQNINSHTVEHLVQCYPSHDFIIDDDEARQWFTNVDFPSEELYRLVGALGPMAFNEADDPCVVALSAEDTFEDEQDEEAEEASGDAADSPGAAEMGDRGAGDQSGDTVSAGSQLSGDGSEKDAAPEGVQDSDRKARAPSPVKDLGGS
jgi:Serine dehydrogenase proteinase